MGSLYKNQQSFLSKKTRVPRTDPTVTIMGVTFAQEN